MSDHMPFTRLAIGLALFATALGAGAAFAESSRMEATLGVNTVIMLDR